MLSKLKNLFVNPRTALTEVLGEAGIPTFPALTISTLKALRDPDSSMKKVGELVSTDPGNSVRVLKLVNSAAYGLRRPVNNVNHACTMLGRTTLEGIVLAVAVGDAMPRGDTQGYRPERFWRAAARRATTARALAEVLDPASASASFTAGLLQDLAVPLLAHHKPGYDPMLEQWVHDGGSLEDLERESFGWDHATVAGWLCEDWCFPGTLGSCIAGHHEQEGVPAPVSLVSLLGEAEDQGVEEMIERAHQFYNAPADRVVDAVKRGIVQGQHVARLFAA